MFSSSPTITGNGQRHHRKSLKFCKCSKKISSNELHLPSQEDLFYCVLPHDINPHFHISSTAPKHHPLHKRCSATAHLSVHCFLNPLLLFKWGVFAKSLHQWVSLIYDIITIPCKYTLIFFSFILWARGKCRTWSMLTERKESLLGRRPIDS